MDAAGIVRRKDILQTIAMVVVRNIWKFISAGLSIADLSISEPALEDLFLELTRKVNIQA